MFAADTLLVGKQELVAGLEIHGASIYFTYAELRALEVGKDGYVEWEICVDTVDVLDDLLVLGVSAVREIEAEHIDAGFYKGE